MSTYYSLACRRCREDVTMFRESATGMGFHADHDLAPRFFQKHFDHISEIFVLSECAEEYGDYTCVEKEP